MAKFQEICEYAEAHRLSLAVAAEELNSGKSRKPCSVALKEFNALCALADKQNVSVAKAAQATITPRDPRYWAWECSALRSGSPEYTAYVGARSRCSNPNTENWKHYGGRGIKFRFRSFEHFMSELGRKPGPEYSVDRINNDGHYEPGNVRWATPKEQANNQRRRQRNGR
jgi:hypothetical protein